MVRLLDVTLRDGGATMVVAQVIDTFKWTCRCVACSMRLPSNNSPK